MAYNVKCRCPDCGDVYTVHIKDDSELPNFCPHCGSYVGGDENFIPSQLNIGTSKGKAPDNIYRAMEEGANFRAELTGDPAMKITNMKDNLREGDVAAVPVVNDVTKYRDEANKTVNFDYWQGARGTVQENVAMANSGPNRQHTGAKVLEAIQDAPATPRVPRIAGLKAGFGGIG